MRIKQVWQYVPLPAKLKLVYNRLTLSRITTAYFILAFIHCVVQVVFQSEALAIERGQSVIIQGIIRAGNVTEKFAALDSKDFIELCHAIPGQTSDRNPCKIFVGESDKQAKGSHHSPTHHRRQSSSKLIARDLVFTGRVDSNGEINGVTVTGLSGLQSVTLSDTCTQVLAWPDQIVSQATREALAMIAFQLWLFGISIVAILNESIPHVLAALVTHVFSTAWASFQIARTRHFEQRFTDIVTNAACGGIDLMPTYWKTKIDNQIPILVLNGTSLLVSFFLSWKLCKQYGVQSFNRVGASPTMHRIYLLVLVLSVSLQLTAFFLVTSLALWIEQLSDGPIAPFAEHRVVYLGVFIATAVLILPWLYMGWIAVRREHRRMMLSFLMTSTLLIVAQTGMFLSPVYRLTFNTWTFFGALTVAAYVLLVLTFCMAIVCRSFFGRGLAHFLKVQNALEECNFTPVYFARGLEAEEKGSMPWDGNSEVRHITLQRENEEESVHDISSAHVRAPQRVHFADNDGGRPIARLADQEASVTSDGAASPAPSPSTNLPDDQTSESASGHKRDNSSGTWYDYAGGREFIQRGVNVRSPAVRGFNLAASRRITVGLPGSVKPQMRPPGLDSPRIVYAPGRI